MITVDQATLAALVDGTHSQPHAVLGPHTDDSGVTVRVLRPDATEVDVVVGDRSHPMQHEYSGIWVAELPGDEDSEEDEETADELSALPADGEPDDFRAEETDMPADETGEETAEESDEDAAAS